MKQNIEHLIGINMDVDGVVVARVSRRMPSHPRPLGRRVFKRIV